MRTIITTLSIAIAGFVVQLFLPWWSLAVVAFLIGIASDLGRFKIFLSALVGSALVWGGYALYIHTSTEAILTNKMAGIFGLQQAWLLVLISALVAGLAGGFAGLTGKNIRSLINK